MAIDTLERRNSVLNVTSFTLPIPDNTIAAQDRQTLLKTYSGILAGTVVIIIRKLQHKLSIHIGI